MTDVANCLTTLEDDRNYVLAQLAAAPTDGWGTIRIMWENRLRQVEEEIAACPQELALPTPNGAETE